jgi:hypothetical protein
MTNGSAHKCSVFRPRQLQETEKRMRASVFETIRVKQQMGLSKPTAGREAIELSIMTEASA